MLRDPDGRIENQESPTAGTHGGWDALTYGNRWSDIYDRIGWPKADDAVEFLARQAGSGPVLELAIGTGRVAIPLVERGIEIHGIDSSKEMLERLRAKESGADIPVTIADMADFTCENQYSLAFLVLNTIYGLQTQEEQLSCFASVAAALKPGGRFVVEGFIPSLTRMQHNTWTQVHHIDLDQVLIEADKQDPSTQQIREQHIHLRPDSVRLYPVFMRYIWPSEMDLMARLAGMHLVERWGGWLGERFTARSTNQVSVYQLDAG